MAIEDYCVLLFFVYRSVVFAARFAIDIFFRIKLKFTSTRSLTKKKKKNRICLFASELNS